MKFESAIYKSALTFIASITLSASCFAADANKALPQVEIKTSMGNIVVELDPEAAPKTVDNFLGYVKDGFYDGTIFHRVINNFMIQGGGMDKDMKEKKTKAPVPLEAAEALQHGLKNDLGTIAMARTQDPNSATSQFFINVRNNEILNSKPIPEGDPVEIPYQDQKITITRADAIRMNSGYTPFGHVVEGMDVVNKIKEVETATIGANANVPKKTITIISVKVLKKNIEPKAATK